MEGILSKNIAINHVHETLGAKMVEYAGYKMPLQYAGLREEHLCVRNGVGVFDVSHMGEFIVSGPDALELIQKVTSNDASVLVDGKVQYSCLPNPIGGIIDDLLVYRFNEESYCLVVNASNIQKDWDWITSQNDCGAELKNISDNMSLFAVQGPKAAESMQSLTEVDLSAMEYYTSQYAAFAGVPTVLISATGYTGSGGFEIYVKNDEAEKVWNAIMSAGEKFDIQPCGLAARDTLRLEMGFCLYGNDINDTTSPLEAGLGWITKFTKDFVNSDNLKSQKEIGVERKLVGFEMIDRGIPRQDYELVDDEGNAIGMVTSGTMSPSLGKGIGMGYVTKAMSKSGTEIFVQVRNKRLKAQIVRLPFYKKS